MEPVEPGFPFSIGVESSAGPGSFLLGLVRRGVLRILRAGPTLFLPAGTLFLVPPGSACRLVRDLSTVVAGASFGRSLVDPLSLEGSVDIVVEALAGTSPRFARLHGPELSEAGTIFDSMERETKERRHGFQSMMRFKLTEAILILARAAGGSGEGETGGTLRFHPEEAMQYLRERCTDQLSLAGIASRYGFNPSYFSRLFHRHAGMPLVEYINRARVQRSCQLLKRSEASIIDVALAVGYNNLSHFNRSFRRFIGMSPREYRVFSRK